MDDGLLTIEDIVETCLDSLISYEGEREFLSTGLDGNAGWHCS